jgi:hypothetical protein
MYSLSGPVPMDHGFPDLKNLGPVRRAAEIPIPREPIRKVHRRLPIWETKSPNGAWNSHTGQEVIRLSY